MMKQMNYDFDGLNELAIAVMRQAHEDLNYYPQPRKKKIVDENGVETIVVVPVSKKTLREAERIRQDAKDFLDAMRERYAG